MSINPWTEFNPNGSGIVPSTGFAILVEKSIPLKKSYGWILHTIADIILL